MVTGQEHEQIGLGDDAEHHRVVVGAHEDVRRARGEEGLQGIPGALLSGTVEKVIGRQPRGRWWIERS